MIIKTKIILEAPLKLVFETFFKFDFMQIFKKLWFVPNFDYLILKEQDFRPGNEHKIYFDNGETAVVKLNTFVPQQSFSAEMGHFSFYRYSGLNSMEYFFYFSEDLSKSLCTINCEYHFRFRCKLGVFFFEFFAREVIRRNLDKILVLAGKELSNDGLNIKFKK